LASFEHICIHTHTHKHKHPHTSRYYTDTHGHITKKPASQTSLLILYGTCSHLQQLISGWQSSEDLRSREGYVQVEDNADLQLSVSEELRKEHEMVVVHPYYIILFQVWYHTFKECLIG
jgi:hypothetical protein